MSVMLDIRELGHNILGRANSLVSEFIFLVILILIDSYDINIREKCICKDVEIEGVKRGYKDLALKLH